MAFVRMWWRSIRGLRRIASGATCTSAQLFAMCVIAGYIVELFVRGEGYFTGSGILLAGAVWMTTARDQSVRQEELQNSPVGSI